MSDYTIKAEESSMNQLLKAYSLFEKDVEYVVMDNKKIVDEQLEESWMEEDILMVFTKLLRQRKM